MKNKDISLLLISAFVLIFAWVTFSIYHSSATSTISESLNRNIIPINPSFDTKTIDNLKKREMVIPIYSALESPVLQNVNISSPSSKKIINQNNLQEATKGGALNL